MRFSAVLRLLTESAKSRQSAKKAGFPRGCGDFEMLTKKQAFCSIVALALSLDVSEILFCQPCARHRCGRVC